MIGLDWLRMHRCRLAFGNGALFIGRNRIPLVKGDRSIWCRRVIVAEEVMVEPKPQFDVPTRIIEMKEPQDVVQPDRVVNMTQVKVINWDDRPVVELSPGRLYPVEVDKVVEFESCLARDDEMPLEDSTEEVALETGIYSNNPESDEMHIECRES